MFQYSQELSEKIADKYKHLFEIKGCYENVFKLVNEVEELKPFSKLSVLFCYMPGAAGFYYRHAFCLYNNMIVEPLLHLNMKEKNLDDIVPIKLMAANEYIDLLLADGRYDLASVLKDDDIRAYNGSEIPLNPVDLSDLVSSVTKSPDEFLLVMHSAMNGNGIYIPGSVQPAPESEARENVYAEDMDDEGMEI